MFKAVIIEDESSNHDLFWLCLSLVKENFVIVDKSANLEDSMKSIKLNRPDVVFVDMGVEDRINIYEEFTPINFKVIFITNFVKYVLNTLCTSTLDYLGLDLDRNDQCKKLIINSASKISFIDVNDIIYCKASGPYTNFYLLNGEHLSDSKNIAFYEKVLREKTHFFRPHRSFLINLNYVSKFIKGVDEILLTNGVKIKLAYTAKKSFLESMKKL